MDAKTESMLQEFGIIPHPLRFWVRYDDTGEWKELTQFEWDFLAALQPKFGGITLAKSERQPDQR